MKWSEEAEKTISRVPFFVRKRVRERVEDEARRAGAAVVTVEHIQGCQRRFLEGKEAKIKGYQVERCFGPGGCPHRALADDDLGDLVEAVLEGKDLLSFLQRTMKEPLKMHHEFKVVIADCPNACSRPQIVDVGIIGAHGPELSAEPCSDCGACIEACREDALVREEGAGVTAIDFDRCVACGECVSVCPTGTLVEGVKGYRVLLGGKLGRHPRLGEELSRWYRKEEVPGLVDVAVDHFKNYIKPKERFGDVLTRVGLPSHPLFEKSGSS